MHTSTQSLYTTMYLHLMGINSACLVCVEELKSFTDLVLLLLGEFELRCTQV